jgi:hypothetical protein
MVNNKLKQFLFQLKQIFIPDKYPFICIHLSKHDIQNCFQYIYIYMTSNEHGLTLHFDWIREKLYHLLRYICVDLILKIRVFE